MKPCQPEVFKAILPVDRHLLRQINQVEVTACHKTGQLFITGVRSQCNHLVDVPTVSKTCIDRVETSTQLTPSDWAGPLPFLASR